MKKDRIFFIINETNETLSLSNYPRHIVNLVLNLLSKVMDVDASWVHLTAVSGEDPALLVSRGLNGAQGQELQSPGLRSVLEDRIGTGDLVVVPDLSRDGNLGSSSFAAAGFGSLVAVPLMTEQSRGVLGAMWRLTKPFDADYGFLLLVIGNLVCSALERAALYGRLLGQTEPEPEIKYDIEEFDRLVTLAEQYSRATRLAISEAVVRAKGEDGALPRHLAAPDGGGELLLPNGVTLEDAPELPRVTPGNGDGAGVSDQHEQRMKAFARMHAALTR
jgi:hypothetical protein